MSKIECCLVVGLIVLAVVVYAEDVKRIKDKVDDKRNVSKRGVFHFDGAAVPATYASFFGYQSPLASASVLKIPPNYRSSTLLGTTTPYVLGHGGAIISSYNVNYPRYPYYAVKPYSALSPGLSHINNVFLPSPVVSQAAFFPSRPVIPASPVIPTTPIVPASPAIPATPVVPSNFFVPSQQLAPTFPIVPAKPVLSFPSLFGTLPIAYPQNVIPISVSGSSPGVSTTIATPTTATASVVPGQSWRPVLVNPPTTPSSSIPRPAVSLLPPYEVQQPERGNIEEFHQPSRAYLLPNLQQRLAELQFLRDQQQHQQQQQQLLHQHQQQQQLLETQESEAAKSGTDQGQYFGLSSYDVPLQGNKGYSY